MNNSKLRRRRKHKVANKAAASGRRTPVRTWLVLAVCLGILALGLSLRYRMKIQSAQQVEELKQQIQAAERRADWPRVELLAREWATLSPEDFGPWEAASHAAFQMENPVAAVDYLARMPADAPLEAYLNLSYLQMEMLNDPLAALATCQRTLEVYPEDSETHLRLLYIYTMTCQREAIAREAHRAIACGSDTLATYPYLLGAKWLIFTNGYPTNRKWLERWPGTELFEVAAVLHLPSYPLLDELARQETPDDAEPRPLEFAAKQIQLLREKYPQNLELLAVELRNLCRAGETAAVAARLAAAPGQAANDSRFWRYKGWLHAAHEEWEVAIEAYQTALEMDPLDWATQLELATALRAQADVHAAAEMQDKADLGKRLMIEIQHSPQLDRLQPPSLYGEIQRYFRLCGESELADDLEKHLASLESPRE